MASEQSARMVAMKAASDNAGDADRRADADLQQEPAGGDHQGAVRNRRRRRGGLSRINVQEERYGTSTRHHRPVHRRGDRHRVSARGDAEGLRRADRSRIPAQTGFAEKGLTFEVEQQLGDGVVRCIALGSSDGLRRGMKVHEHRRADLGAGRQGHARAHHGRARPPDRRGRPDQDRRAPLDPPGRAQVRRAVARRSSCSRPASR